MSTLEVIDLVAGYGGAPVLRGVSLRVSSGRVTAVLGPNGAGKSTLAKAVVGLLEVSKGHVLLDGRDITGVPPYELVRLGVGYMPQLMSIFGDLTVLENLEMGAYTYAGELNARVREVLDLFPDLRENPKKRASQLSGGQQRMLALARTLMVDPRVIVLDEPTAGLAPMYTAQVWRQVVQIRDRGVGMMVVEQNVRAAVSHADDAVLLTNGKVAMEGTAAEVGKSAELGALLVS
jgi:ABC-type branched-subunit amino acid transport system ATPase component